MGTVFGPLTPGDWLSLTWDSDPQPVSWTVAADGDQRNPAGGGLSHNRSYVKRTPVRNPRSETVSGTAGSEAV